MTFSTTVEDMTLFFDVRSVNSTLERATGIQPLDAPLAPEPSPSLSDHTNAETPVGRWRSPTSVLKGRVEGRLVYRRLFVTNRRGDCGPTEEARARASCLSLYSSATLCATNFCRAALCDHPLITEVCASRGRHGTSLRPSLAIQSSSAAICPGDRPSDSAGLAGTQLGLGLHCVAAVREGLDTPAEKTSFVAPELAAAGRRRRRRSGVRPGRPGRTGPDRTSPSRRRSGVEGHSRAACSAGTNGTDRRPPRRGARRDRPGPEAEAAAGPPGPRGAAAVQQARNGRQSPARGSHTDGKKEGGGRVESLSSLRWRRLVGRGRVDPGERDRPRRPFARRSPEW